MTADVTVVVPMRDNADTVLDQLRALEAQEIPVGLTWEVVVVDNGSTDRSVDVVAAHPWPGAGLRVVDGSGSRGPGHARNVGVHHALGRHLMFCDADDVVGHGWVLAHRRALQQHDAAYGPIREFRSGAPDFSGEWVRRDLALVRPYVLLPSGNMSVRREVFEAVGGFSEDLDLSEDMDFSVRLQAAGYTVAYVPEAKLCWRRPLGARREFTKQRAYALRARRTLVRLEAHHIVGERVSPAWKKVAWLLEHAPATVRSETGRCEWAGVAGKLAGQLQWQWDRVAKRTRP